MITKTSLKMNNQSGFALLMTLIVVSVIISIGLSVLDLAIKQVELASNSKDSEIAFHAANAGMECAQYWRRAASSTMEAGNPITPDCFSGTINSNTVDELEAADGVSGDGNVYLYNYEITWGTAASRCSRVTALVANATLEDGTEVGLEIDNMNNHIPGYPDTVKECEPGERCTILSVKGYNRECSTATGYGSVEREVLLQF